MTPENREEPDKDIDRGVLADKILIVVKHVDDDISLMAKIRTSVFR